MDRYDYEEKINKLLDDALNELNPNAFELLLCRVTDIIQDYD